MSSPYRDDAIEYRRTVFGLPGFFGPSQYGILPSWLMMMCVVSPVAATPTIRFVEITLPLNGVLFLYVFTGTPDWSQYGLASRKSCALPAPASDSEYADSSFAASPPTAAFSNHIASMRTGAETRLMPTFVASGALYDTAVCSSPSMPLLS